MYPNLFHIGPLTIHSYGLMMALAFLAGIFVATRFADRQKLDRTVILDLVFYILLAALVGAKLLILIVDLDYYKQDWHRLLGLYQVGGVFYGGLVFAILITAWYIRKKRLDFWQTTDVLVMGLIVGQILGRMGCFLAGCCWGKEAPSDFPLAVTFRNPLAAEQVGTPLNIPLYPTQLMEAGLLLLIFLALLIFYKRRKFAGQQFSLYLILYSVARFWVEFYRGDPRGSVFNGALSTSQLISIFTFVAGIVIYAIRRRKMSAAIR